MYNLDWSRKELTPQKLGTFGEYYAKMTLASYGMSIYTSEVDDHGIDFVAETEKGFLKFQVKTIRENTKYVNMLADNFKNSDTNLYLFLTLLTDGEHPVSYIIPATRWQNIDKMFVYRDYEKPEYGINLSAKNIPNLDTYKMEKFINNIVV